MTPDSLDRLVLVNGHPRVLQVYCHGEARSIDCVDTVDPDVCQSAPCGVVAALQVGGMGELDPQRRPVSFQGRLGTVALGTVALGNN